MVADYRRWAAYAVTAPAVFLAARLIHEGVMGQLDRLGLVRRHGLVIGGPACTTGYCDETMFWLAGFLVRHGRAALLYDHAAYTSAAAAVLPYARGYWPFVYPPVLLLPAAAISLLPLVAGYYVVSAALVAVSVLLLRGCGIAWWCIGVGLLSPAVLWNVYLGQLGLVCGALLLAGLGAIERAPLRAGVMLALLCIKPPYALLAPVAVIAGRHVRAGLVACTGIAVLLALSWWFCGGATWAAYLGPGRAEMRALLQAPFGNEYEAGGTSVFWMARSFGAGLGLAYAAQAASAAAAGWACWKLWARPGTDKLRRATCTALLTLLACPYGFTYDLSAYSVLLPTLARRETPWRNAALAWLWVAPGYVQRCSNHFGVLLTPLLILAALGLALKPSSPPSRRCALPDQRSSG
jgi:hypothetical protein